MKYSDPTGHVPERSPMIDNQIGLRTPHHTPEEVSNIIMQRTLNNLPEYYFPENHMFSNEATNGLALEDMAVLGEIRENAYGLHGWGLNFWLQENGYNAQLNGSPCATGACLTWHFGFGIPMYYGIDDENTSNDSTGWYFNINVSGGGVTQSCANVESSYTFWTTHGSHGSANYSVNSEGESLQFEYDVRTGALDVNIGDQVQFFGNNYSVSSDPYFMHVATVTGFDIHGMPLLTDTGDPGLINQPLSAYQNALCPSGGRFVFSEIRVLSHPEMNSISWGH